MDFAWMALSQAWQVTALIVFVVVMTRLVTRNRPHLAYILWLVVLVKCVTPPLWSSPAGAFTWVQTAFLREGSDEITSELVVAHPQLALELDVTTQPTLESDDVVLHLEPYEYEPDPVRADFNHGDQDDTLSTWLLVLVAVWGAGVALALVVTGYRWWHCLWSLWRTPALSVPDLETLLSKLSRQLKVRRRVRLLITSSRIGPAVIGLLRPVIVLPEVVVRDKQPAELEAILAHELIHVRRGDLWLGLLQVCAKAVWWFYPLVWWVNRLATREAERCCDEEVIGELGCDPKRYARSLLEVLELRRTLQPVPAFPGMKPVEVTSQRLERIMKLGQGCHKRTPRWCWAVMLLLAAAALPGAAFIAADDEPKTYPDLLQHGERIKVEGRGGQTLGHFVTDGKDTFHFQGVSTAVAVPDGGTVLLGDSKRLRNEAENAMPLVVASYAPAGALTHIKEELGCDASEALQRFGNVIVAAARFTNGPISIEDRVRICDGKITVAASAEEHERMAEAAARVQKYGVAQISIDIRFVAVSERTVKQKIKDWELTPIDLGSQAAGSKPAHGLEPIDRPWPTDTTQPLAKAGVTTTTNLPALYKIIDAEQAQRLLEQLQEDKRSNVLSAPKVTLFNGQSATIADSTLRPFVVAVTTVGDEVRAAQPHIQVVESGRIVRLRPLLRNTNKLWLDYDVKVSHIEEVRETTVHAAGLAEPVTLQVPKVHTARVESAVEFELGKTVVIGGLPEASDRGKKHQLLLLMTAKRSQHRGSNAVVIEEAQTGKLMFGAGVTSELGVRSASSVDERNFVDREGRQLVPILGPLTSGKEVPPAPPSDDEVLRALDHTRGEDPTWPKSEDRFNVRVVKERVAEYVDPPRFIPTIGPAQLHHAHYKCTIYCSLLVDVEEPTPHKIEKELTEVVYIDHNHFHLVGNDDRMDLGHKSIQEKLEQRADIHVRNGTLSMWLDEIQTVWDVYIFNDVADGDVTLSGKFVDTPLKEVLAKVLPWERCSFRPVDESLLITRLDSDGKDLKERRLATRSVVDGATRQLDRQVSVDFVEVPLAEALERIGSQIQINVLIDEADIAIEGVTPETNVTFRLPGTKIKAKSVLDGILKSLNLRYEVKHETLHVRGKSSEPVYAAVYNVADLLAADLDYITPEDFESGYADRPRRNLDLLETVIPQRVSPDSWNSTGGKGAIESFSTNLSLVVSQTALVHRQVAGLLRDLRQRLGLATLDAAKQQRLRPPERSDAVYLRVYNVAELVIPVPGINSGERPSAIKSPGDAAVTDFDTLIDLITSTIAPDTWEEQGGAGSIKDFPTNLSLVVSQSAGVHEQLSELLQQLRRSHDLQITVEARFIQIPENHFERLGVGFEFSDGDKERLDLDEVQDQGHAILSKVEAFFLVQAVQASKQGVTLAGPKVTMFNGQAATISLAGEGGKPAGSFQFQAVCLADRRSVRLGFAAGADADIMQAQAHTIPLGETLLLSVTDDVTSEMLGITTPIQGVPVLDKIPYTSRLFKRQQPLPTERLLLITPTIIVREEEEKLGIKIEPE